MSNREPLAVQRLGGNQRYLRSEANILDPARLFRALRRSWLWLLLPPIALAGLGGLSASRQESRFEATTMLALQQTAAQDRLSGDRSNALAEREIQTEAKLLNGPAMEALVEQELGRSITFEAEAVEGTDLIQLTAEAPTAALAATDADEIALLYLGQRRERVQADLDAAAANLEARIVDLERRLAAADAAVSPSAETSIFAQDTRAQDLDPALVRLQENLESDLSAAQYGLDQLIDESALSNGGIRIAATATPPDERLSPNPVRSAVLWGMLGILLGFGIVWLREVLDRQIRNTADIALLSDHLEFVGPIVRPDTRSLIGPAALLIDEVADRFRVLASNSLTNDDEPLTIQVTGVNGGEGSTFVAVNLAATLASGGWATVVIDADLLDGDLHEVFDVQATPGTKQLLDEQPLATVVQSTRYIHGLGVVAKGARTTADATLHNTALATMLRGLSARFDVVIVDGPPILKSGDAAVLAQHVDKTVLVAKMNETRQPDIEAAVESVSISGGRLTAIALTQPIANGNVTAPSRSAGLVVPPDPEGRGDGGHREGAQRELAPLDPAAAAAVTGSHIRPRRTAHPAPAPSARHDVWIAGETRRTQ